MSATPRHSKIVLTVALAGLGLLVAYGAYRWFWASGASAEQLEWAFQHDEAGRLLRAREPGGKTSTYDYLSFPGAPQQVKTVTRRFSGGQEVFEFDRYGRRSGMQDQAGMVRYAWDNLGQLQRIERAGGATITYTYDVQGRLSDYSLGAGNTIAYGYDLMGRVASINTPAGAITYAYLTGQGKTVRILPNGVRTVWDFSPDGQVEAITHVDRSNYVISKFAYEYRPDGLVASVVEWSPQHGECRRALEYDQVQRLVEAKDSDGNLVGRTVRGERTTFVPDPLADNWRPLMAKASNGVQRLYLWAGEQPLGVIENGQATFFLTDHLESVRGRVDSSGKAGDTLDYSPFGASNTPVSGADLVPGFAGIFWDPVAGIYLTKARAYVPQLGRFLQPDPEHRVPAGSQKDMSIYAYCGGDPVNYVDRTGAAPVPINPETLRFLAEKLREYLFQREDVMRNVWEKAFREPRGAPGINSDMDLQVRRAYDTVLTWRSNPEILKQAFPDPKSRPTAFELRDVENALLIQKKVETGETGRFLEDQVFGVPLKPFNAPPGPLSFLTSLPLIAAWKVVHGFYDVFPYVRNPLDSKGETLPQAPLTLWRQVVGGWRGMTRSRPIPEPPLAAERSNRPPTRPMPVPAPPRVRVDKPDPPYVSSLKRPDDRYPGLFPPGWPRGTGSGNNEFPPPGGGGGVVRSPLRPSPVGGVYLGGAGKSLAGLGPLRRISVDPATGRLVLVAENVGDLKLPSLRLDDVVTVFRSVYLHGVGPSVTIDPRPGDPEGPLMNIVHGAATRDTYVGSVLFQADRIMKAYSIGQDNATNTPLTSTVPGYGKVRGSIFFGGNHEVGKATGGSWERFWIVPAEVKRFDSGTRGLTLVDVPLKVRTQKMVMKNGKLEDDTRGSSSTRALNFSDWFTRNYEGIGRERYLQPPTTTDITAPVPVFAELRRIALVTAIAEQLRDQGVPMPSWVNDYEVNPIPLATTTPAITVRMSRTTDRVERRASVYGGVNFSVPSAAVKRFSRAGDVQALSPEKRKDYARLLSLSDSLVPELERAVSGAPLLTPVSVRSGDAQLQAVALPGAGTMALLPGRVQEVDLEVPIESGGSIALTRSFNSFFQPTDAWGKSWSMDLPRLDEMRMPQQRTDKGVTFKIVLELNSPLGSHHARFSESAQVPEVGAKLLAPDKPGNILGLAGANDLLVPGGKTSLIFRDGRRWIFHAQGNIGSDKRTPYATVYLRDSVGHLR